MATYKGKWRQKTGDNTSDILHPETEAGVVTYSNTTRGLTATDVQAAIDEIVQTGVGVTGVKGNEETTYRSGNVNLTSANIGAVDTTEKGAASGVATLDANSKVPTTQLPDAVVGQMLYGGTVSNAGVATLTTNAKAKLGVSTTTITLPTTPTSAYEGIYFIADNTCSASTIVGVAGFNVGDWLVATDGAWSKIDNTDAVASVNSKTGIVVLAGTDIPYASTTDTTTVKAKVDAVESSVKITNATVDTTGVTGNAITGLSISNGQLVATGTATYLVASDISGKADKASMTAGTYSAVTVNSQGIVTAGSQVLGVIENGGSTAGIVTGGWYFEKDAV